MRSTLPSIFFAIVLLAACTQQARAQDVQDPATVMDDLCGCMSSIDLKGSDGAVRSGVRDCLEQAVIEHPAEVRSILARSHGQGSRAFQLGSLLGGGLERTCAPFRALRARLQQMPAAVKQGT